LKKITVGTIATLAERAESLREHVAQTGLAVLVIEIPQFPTDATSWPTRQLLDADPEVLLIDIGNSANAVENLGILHATLPNARLLVTSTITDPQLIIELMRTGVREFLPSPLSQQSLLQALNRYVSEKELKTSHTRARARRGKLYCVTSAKHGSGATTVALNLAGIIAARSGQRVGLIDLDRPLGDAAAYLNVKSNFTVTDAIGAGVRLDSVLLESYMQSTNGFHVLPGFHEHSADTSLSAEKLSHLLDVAQSTFEHTIADLPTNLDEDQVKVITRNSSTILVVLTPELPAIWRTERLLSYLTKLHAADKVRIVLNRSTRADEITDADIERLLRTSLYCKLPNEYAACIKAINSGSLLDSTTGKALYKSITALATDLAGLPEVEAKRGFLGLLLKPSIGGNNA
jgi:pilus assembly protein CpaE